MLRCPHCSAPLTLTDLFSNRIFTPRTCRTCTGQYFEGGTTVGFALIGAGGGLATSMASIPTVPSWVPLVVTAGSALVAVILTCFVQPRKVQERRSKLVRAILIGPGAALIVWGIVALAT